jgi:hypothetical protein
MANFGEGLSQFAGAGIGASDLASGARNVNATADMFSSTVAPYNTFGQSFLNPASAGIGQIAEKAGQTQGYEDFLKNYQTSPGAKYQLGVADEAQNNSAAAKGQLLSGSNLRQLSTINQGIASTDANQAYGSYLAGNNQQFGQLESSLGNMFKAIGVGETATGQQAGVQTAQMGNQAALAQAQAKNDQSKGSGLGSMFSGIGSMALAF